MATIKVDPGICGLMTELTVTSEDGMNAVFKVKTDCPHIKNLVEAVPTVNGYEEVFAKYGEGKIAQAAKEYCSHGACPVPTGMLKGVEIVCSLALPKDVKIEIEK
jgi:hypothetical protein